MVMAYFLDCQSVAWMLQTADSFIFIVIVRKIIFINP